MRHAFMVVLLAAAAASLSQPREEPVTESMLTHKTLEKGCVIEADQVTENGVKRPLTEEEKQRLADYAIALDEYFKLAFHPKQLAKPKGALPTFPDICKSDEEVVSEHHVVAFGGCSVADDQLYIDGKFERKLTEEEKKQLKEFREGVEAFKALMDEFLIQQERAGSRLARREPQPPSPPRICPSMVNAIEAEKKSRQHQ